MMRLWIGLMLALLLKTPVVAADWYTGVPTDGPEPHAAPTIAIDVAFDGSTQKAFSGAAIATIAPFSTLEQSGARLRLYGLGGVYNYYSTDVGKVNGQIEAGAVMGGYEWVSKTLTVAAYAGLELSNTSISPNDPQNTVKGGNGGLRVGFDLYYMPTATSMIAAVAYYSTNHNGYYSRVKFGMAIADYVYVGPEALFLGDDFFQQYRLGVHVSGLRLGALQMGISGGALEDRVRGVGGYGILESRVAF
jgi:hypothetical protein